MIWWLPAAGHATLRVAATLIALLPFACAVLLRLRARTRTGDVHRRGVLLADGRNAVRRARRRRLAGAERLTLAGVDIAPLDEVKHFKVIGTTGTGKSTAIQELLAGAIGRGDRAVIADPDGGYMRRFFAPYRGDVLLNPFEPGSVRWDWCAEIHDRYDVEQLASGLIPSSADASGQEWRGYARTFFNAVARRCRDGNRRSAAELWRLLTVASSEELRPLVAGTPAQPFLDPDNARMFGSIRSVTGSAVAALEHIEAQRAAPFSVRHWVRDCRAPGSLYIPYKAGQIAALRSMIAAWLRLAIFEAMNGAEDRDQRLWVIVDELDALGAIDGLKDALARLRKFGGRCVIGLQSIAQVSSTYGGGDAQTIVENCGNTLILRCASSENGGTSQFASKLIGEREVRRRQTARNRERAGWLSKGGARRSTNISEQFVTEAAVMPSEIEQLADLRGYLKRASSPAWFKVALRPPPFAAARGFFTAGGAP
ncbi:MAG TPA: type IV secretion system DNA-binding domain-containing protein [Steroidobacteraceae bacterium]|nr:type IV secretion system DNA-binding domain-containing protein [Steroidobacteraceae bacterium]